MTGWQVDEMVETRNHEIWEELNAPDPYENELFEAAKSLQVAIKHLDKATDWVADAASEVQGTPMEPVLMSYVDSLSDLLHSLKKQQEKYERGIRD